MDLDQEWRLKLEGSLLQEEELKVEKQFQLNNIWLSLLV